MTQILPPQARNLDHMARQIKRSRGGAFQLRKGKNKKVQARKKKEREEGGRPKEGGEYERLCSSSLLIFFL